MRKLWMAMMLVSGAAMAADVEVSDCVIQEVVSGMDMTGAFVTFHNTTEQPIVLKSAAVSSLSEHVELHKMVHENGVMVMEQMPEYVIQPGESPFKKGGNHIMIMDVAKAPAVDSEHEMTFTFANGETATCVATVKSVADVMALYGGDHHGGMNHEHHDHGKMKDEHHDHGEMKDGHHDHDHSAHQH